MIPYLENKDFEVMQTLLKDIKEYVIVVGSVAEGRNNEKSDIDFYVKTKPEKEFEKELELNNYSTDGIEETYIDVIIKILGNYGIDWESEFVIYYNYKCTHTTGIFTFFQDKWKEKIESCDL